MYKCANINVINSLTPWGGEGGGRGFLHGLADFLKIFYNLDVRYLTFLINVKNLEKMF